jgi:hypothetical protein
MLFLLFARLFPIVQTSNSLLLMLLLSLLPSLSLLLSLPLPSIWQILSGRSRGSCKQKNLFLGDQWDRMFYESGMDVFAFLKIINVFFMNCNKYCVNILTMFDTKVVVLPTLRFFTIKIFRFLLSLKKKLN